MSIRNRTPSAVDPYLQLPPETSLILLTSTLACSGNWLTARFVSSALSTKQDDLIGGDDGSPPGVVLVSWMRDLTFWKNEIRRATACDVTKQLNQGDLMFVDQLAIRSPGASGTLIAESERYIRDAIVKIRRQGQRKVVLVLDNPDLLVAIGAARATELNHLILKMRSLVYSTILTCAADLPLITAAASSAESLQLPLEVETASFIAQQAHVARCVMSLRELKTGSARDVSGVLRVTRGGDSHEQDVRELEALYLVQRDGSLRVFERGAESV